MFVSLVLACPLLFAQEPTHGASVPDLGALRLEEPLPVRGDPWDLELLAYLLPPQDVSWLTTTDPFRSCVLAGSFVVGTAPSFEVRSCPEPMVSAALGASQLWQFAAAPDADAQGTTHFEIRYVVRYAEMLGTMTTHVTLDPGADAAFEGVVGVPGIKLVHPAQLTKAKQPKLPRSARKAGLEPQECTVGLSVDPVGKPKQLVALDCPEPLRAAAVKAATKYRYSPRVVDGMTEVQELEVTVSFR